MGIPWRPIRARISPTRSRNIVRALAVASRNFEDPKRPRLDHELKGYGDFREIIDADLDLALDEAHDHDGPHPRLPSSLSRLLSSLK